MFSSATVLVGEQLSRPLINLGPVQRLRTHRCPRISPQYPRHVVATMPAEPAALVSHVHPIVPMYIGAAYQNVIASSRPAFEAAVRTSRSSGSDVDVDAARCTRHPPRWRPSAPLVRTHDPDLERRRTRHETAASALVVDRPAARQLADDVGGLAISRTACRS